ncbi:hypothetical protein EYF80_021088 [Liparis tanakae]|uniref:Uncharacterized protein n=1 Tax=Liparis tanakae TaxID=230148 RepID=A0A4Z2HS58_9TELE|nr:hypothetical protein EYF80_021088 [Liparis tanakae]
MCWRCETVAQLHEQYVLTGSELKIGDVAGGILMQPSPQQIQPLLSQRAPAELSNSRHQKIHCSCLHTNNRQEVTNSNYMDLVCFQFNWLFLVREPSSPSLSLWRSRAQAWATDLCRASSNTRAFSSSTLLP